MSKMTRKIRIHVYAGAAFFIGVLIVLAYAGSSAIATAWTFGVTFALVFASRVIRLANHERRNRAS